MLCKRMNCRPLQIVAFAACLAGSLSLGVHGDVHSSGSARGVSGRTPEAVVAGFLAAYSERFGLEDGDRLVPNRLVDPTGDGVELLVTKEGTTKFLVLSLVHERAGIPVEGSRVVLLCRLGEELSLVHVSAHVVSLGAFAPTSIDLPETSALSAARGRWPGATILGDAELVIWAGGDVPARPRLAVAAEVVVAQDSVALRYRIIVDLEDGSMLDIQNRVFEFNGYLAGEAIATSTSGEGAMECEDEAIYPMPWVRIEAGGVQTHADGAGFFSLTLLGDDATIAMRPSGRFFDVRGLLGEEYTVYQDVHLPSDDIVVHLNEANRDEATRAAANAYVHANLVRDELLLHHPGYPGIPTDAVIPIKVNGTLGTCQPMYQPETNGGPAIYLPAGDGENCVNSAIPSITYHEYGHHVIWRGGVTAFIPYHEGMSDWLSILMTDTPEVGSGWATECGIGFRTADNDMQYPCDPSDGLHGCGTLLSGCFWDLRENLLADHPETYRQELWALTVGSILLYTGTEITPAIFLDLLALDDDDGDLSNGTPNCIAIFDAFARHGMAVFPECAGDLGEPDGFINGADLLIVLGDWGCLGACDGDANRDGIVDGADIVIVLGQWGRCTSW